MKNDKVSSHWPIDIYSILFSLTLLLHLFNDTEIASGIKLFYIPALAAFVITILRFRRKDKVRTCVFLFAISTLFGSLVSPNPDAFGSAITFTVVIISSLGVRYVNNRKLILTANMAIPFALFLLLGLYYSASYYRFSGYYNDPNYLCTTLIAFLYVIFMGMRMVNWKIIQIAFILEIIIIVMLIGFTVSRTGAICVLVLIIGSYWNFLKSHANYAIVVAAALMGFLYYSNPEAIQTTRESYERRAESNDTFESASQYRWSLSVRGVTFILDHPSYLLLGIGSGSTAQSQKIPDYPPTRHGDHNSWTSCFTEHGLIGFACFMFILANTFNPLVAKRNGKRRFDMVKLISLMSVLIFSFSISMMLYLPFWWLIFCISNRTDENTTYSLLRSK